MGRPSLINELLVGFMTRDRAKGVDKDCQIVYFIKTVYPIRRSRNGIKSW